MPADQVGRQPDQKHETEYQQNGCVIEHPAIVMQSPGTIFIYNAPGGLPNGKSVLFFRGNP
jgi:hypothetical protein